MLINKFRKIGFPMLLLVVLGCTSGGPTEIYDILIQNAQIIDLEKGTLLQEDIFISNGRIQKISPHVSGTSPKSKVRLDAAGKFILPGFWDNHVHFRGGDSLIQANKNFLKLFLANGITTVRDAGGDLTPSVMEWKRQITDNQLIGPTIFSSGPKIDGPHATWAGSLEVQNDEDIFKALDSLQNIPVDFVKLYDSQISGENYLKTISEAENRGLITSGHMPFTVTLEETIGAGIDAIEHLYYVMKGCSSKEDEITQQLIDKKIGFWDAMPLLMASYQDSVARRTFEDLKANNVYVVPTLYIGKTLSYLDAVSHDGDPYLQYMGSGVIKTYQGRINRARNSSKKAIADRKALDTLFGILAKRLNEAHVGLLAGSDCGAFNSYIYPGISLHKELKAMVDAGISPLEALRTSAYNGAKFLQKESDFGTIAIGKVSDLVILDANPLEKIGNTEKIYAVIKGDSIYNKQRLQHILSLSIQK
ncbi:MAG: amidohydrolase family protein [Maribacter sp.]|nr:amidohydrolase family protein [Maribacter sp.]